MPDYESIYGMLPHPELSDFLSSPQSAEPYAIATIIRTYGSTSVKTGNKVIITNDGKLIGFTGGSCTHNAILKAGEKVIKNTSPSLIRIIPKNLIEQSSQTDSFEVYGSNCPSRGQYDLLIEPVIPNPFLIIFGKGQIANALATMAKLVELTPVFVETSEADQVAVSDIKTITQNNLKNLPLQDQSFIIIATQGEGDRLALESAIKTSCPYIGFVASRKKYSAIKQRLKDNNYTEQDISRIESPAGLNIGALNAGEIAVSILADIIERRRKEMMEGETK